MKKRDRKSIGSTKDVGWQVGARRTYAISHTEAWKLLTSPKFVRIWLGDAPDIPLAAGSRYELSDGTSGAVRVLSINSHLRITWYPKDWPRPSTLQIRVIPKEGRTVIAFHQEHIPGPNEREERRIFFTKVLDDLERDTEDK